MRIKRSANADDESNEDAVLSISSANIPSENDRKTILGCLAAVLNIMFSYQHSKSKADISTKSKADISQQDVINFSIRHPQSHIRRTKELQRELLTMSAGLLFLSPDNATVFMPNLDIQCENDHDEQKSLLRPFLESLSNSEEAFRCISLLLPRFLLLSSEETTEEEGKSNTPHKTIIGYDCRVRYAFKHLAVSILSYFELKDFDFATPDSAAAHATRKFEALEDGIALRLAALSEMMQNDSSKAEGNADLIGQKQQKGFGKAAIRGLKIGAAGIAAGTVFAITGGIAAPAIVGGIAALTGAGATATMVATILLLPAATTVFGAAGGTIVATKMSKRTAGLKEFDIEKINYCHDKTNIYDSEKSAYELSRTICISGWLRDGYDFQRPFGIAPTALTDKHELLCRYCSVYAPHMMPHCQDIVKEWEGKEDDLWETLRASYGNDPDSLLPIEKGPRYDAFLTEHENESLDKLICSIGLPVATQRSNDLTRKDQTSTTLPASVDLLSDVLLTSEEAKPKVLSDADIRFYKAWDFSAEYASELYVVRWEKYLLLELNGSAREFQKDLAKTAAEEALKKTAMASLLAAVAIPSTLLSLSNIIDEKWTIVAERSDEAGKLLAQSLLDSNAGNRPINLIGFSFGARMIVACLRELARHQILWEQQQQRYEGEQRNEKSNAKKRSSLKNSLSMSSGKKRDTQECIYIREPASIIEDVILMGCPASINTSTWASCRDIVGGRLVNCYSRKDMILALMYRVKNLTQILSPPAGIIEVNVAGVENCDVSSLVSNHGEYRVAVREILNLVGYNQPKRISTIEME